MAWQKSRSRSLLLSGASIFVVAAVGVIAVHRAGTRSPVHGKVSDIRIRRLQVGAPPTEVASKVVLPQNVADNLSDVWQPYHGSSDTPIFWHILKSGGTTVQSYMMDCLNQVVANEQGVLNGHGADSVLQVVQAPSERRFVNVDTTLKEGIDRAKSMGLAASGLADTIISPLFPEIVGMMDAEHKGRMFTILRHPIDRAASMFYYLQVADWEPTYKPEFKDMTIEQYLESEQVESNWMIRSLIDRRRGGGISKEDIEVATEILRTKFILGFTDNMGESFRRFEMYFGWKAVDVYRKGALHPAGECRSKYLSPGQGTNRHEHPKVESQSDAWKKLHDLNWADIVLYNNAVELFKEQGALFRATEETR